MAPTRVPESTFYRQELSRALTENAFAIDRSELLQPSSPSDDETFAAATVVLLEGTTITIECLNDGFRVRGRKDSKVYDTLDSLLLNESPKSMEKVSMQLTSKLESLITKEQDLQVSEDEGSAQHPGEGENTIQQPMPAVAKEAEEAQDSKTTPRVTQSSPHELLSSERQPTTNATLTIRCIKSFEYRTEKNLVLQHLDLTTLTVAQLIELCKDKIKTTAGFKPYRTVVFDTLKLYTQAHSHKTMNLIINLENDHWILSDPEQTLADAGAVNETEYSLFNRETYNAFKANPTIKWE